MAREHFWAYLKDQEGRPLVGSDVKVYLAGTADEAIIFSTPASAFVSGAEGIDSSIIDQSTWVTGASGFFDFYVGNEWEPENGYSASQQFRLKWADATVTPSAGGEIDYLPIFDFIFPVDETSTNTGKNKLVSNTQADEWTDHIDLTYAHEIHDWRGVAPSAGTELTENRLVSDLLMYTIAADLDTLLTCGGEAISITASGSLVDVQTIGATAWSPSADGSYYADVTHRLVRNWMFPVYQIYDSDTRDIYWPKNIKDIDLETIRIWSNVDTTNLKMTIVGEIHSAFEQIGFLPVDWDTFSGDSFTGPDGPPNPVVWEERTTQSYDWVIQNNELFSTIGNSGNSDIVSLFKMAGDFDIQLKFHGEAFTPACDLIFGTQNEKISPTRGSQIRVATGAAEEYEEFFLTAAVEPNFTLGEVDSRSSSEGYLGIIRVGTTFTLKYKDGLAAGWTTLQAGRIVTSTSQYIRIQNSSSVAGTGTIYVDDFLINSGTVVAP